MVTLKGESIGVFRGFSDSGLEFRAEVVAPYHSELSPMIGEFLLVEVQGGHTGANHTVLSCWGSVRATGRGLPHDPVPTQARNA